MLNFRTGGEPE